MQGIFVANVRGDNVNFVCRSNISIHARVLVKNASIKSLGNGGGSPTFAQGGGKTKDALPKIYTHIEKVLRNEE